MLNQVILALNMCRVYIILQNSRNKFCPAAVPYGIVRWTGAYSSHIKPAIDLDYNRTGAEPKRLRPVLGTAMSYSEY